MLNKGNNAIKHGTKTKRTYLESEDFIQNQSIFICKDGIEYKKIHEEDTMLSKKLNHLRRLLSSRNTLKIS